MSGAPVQVAWGAGHRYRTITDQFPNYFLSVLGDGQDGHTLNPGDTYTLSWDIPDLQAVGFSVDPNDHTRLIIENAGQYLLTFHCNVAVDTPSSSGAAFHGLQFNIGMGVGDTWGYGFGQFGQEGTAYFMVPDVMPYGGNSGYFDLAWGTYVPFFATDTLPEPTTVSFTNPAGGPDTTKLILGNRCQLYAYYLAPPPPGL